MKKKLQFVFVLMLTVFFLGGSRLVWGQTEQVSTQDAYGKALIQIVDAETNEPIEETYELYFMSSLNPDDVHQMALRKKLTNAKGRAVIGLESGVYYLHCLPQSVLSEYEMEPSPILFTENRLKIDISKGKVTRVIKKVRRGGFLKILLTDTTGNKLLPGDLFSSVDELTAFVHSFGKFGFVRDRIRSHGSLTNRKESFEDGEVVIGRLYPGIYAVTLSFGLLGIENIYKDNITVSRGQTTVCEFRIDLNNKTGIEGYLRDQFGNPLGNFAVRSRNIRTNTNDDGYFKLLGLGENETMIRVHSDEASDNGVFVQKSYGIKLIKGKVIRKDLIIEL